MPKFIVYEITEVRSSYEIEAKHAPTAIRKVKRGEYQSSPTQSIEQHFKAEIVEEETNNDK